MGCYTVNPKDIEGAKKAPLHLIPFPVESEVSLALLNGALKYGPFNWRDSGITYTEYVAAAKRHLGYFMEGEDVDPESGAHHIAHAIAGLVILLDNILTENGPGNDDRPTPGGLSSVRTIANRIATLKARASSSR